MSLGKGRNGWPGCRSWQGRYYCLPITSRLALVPAKPSRKYVSKAVSHGVRKAECKADWSLPSRPKVQNVWWLTSMPIICYHSMVIMSRCNTTCLLLNRYILTGWFNDPFGRDKKLRTMKLTHWGRVTQICVYTLQLCKTGDANLSF